MDLGLWKIILYNVEISASIYYPMRSANHDLKDLIDYLLPPLRAKSRFTRLRTERHLKIPGALIDSQILPNGKHNGFSVTYSKKSPSGYRCAGPAKTVMEFANTSPPHLNFIPTQYHSYYIFSVWWFMSNSVIHNRSYEGRFLTVNGRTIERKGHPNFTKTIISIPVTGDGPFATIKLICGPMNFSSQIVLSGLSWRVTEESDVPKGNSLADVPKGNSLADVPGYSLTIETRYYIARFQYKQSHIYELRKSPTLKHLLNIMVIGSLDVVHELLIKESSKHQWILLWTRHI